MYHSIEKTIGHTPLVELPRLSKAAGAYAAIFAKLEGRNPAGSAKDRAALYMIRAAEQRGDLRPGGTILEPTSGNTGIAIAALATALGYQAILTMPDTMSLERQQLLEAYGAQLVLTPGRQGMAGAIEKARALAREIPGAVILDQFNNPANAQAHYETTGPELWEDSEGTLAALIAGVGTGGTLCGSSRYLKQQNSHVYVLAVEPQSSPVLSGGQPGPHGLQGIGAGFVPQVLNTEIYDEIMRVKGEDAFAAARTFTHSEGLFVGISSGAALWAAVELSKRPENANKTIVALLPDTGDRYLSTPLVSD